MLNTDTLDSLKLNNLRRHAKAELARALYHALRTGVIGFVQADSITAIIRNTEGK